MSLLIFNTTTECFEAWNQTSLTWVSFGCIGCTAAVPIAAAGPNQNPACGVTTATLAGNAPAPGTGLWTVVSGTATITTPTSPTSGVTGLVAAGTVTLRWTISNPPCAATFDDVVITTTACVTFPCAGTVIPIVDVTNPTTGKIWMDRNLGASQVATSSTDAAAYGDLYQWGRCSDGHEKRTSGTTSTLSSTDTPGHGNFIMAPAAPYDWRSPQNNGLWQGVAGVNNPCPTGYRLPTAPELEAERLSWSTNNSAGAFASPLKLVVAGFRKFSTATLTNVGSVGNYWSSSVSGTDVTSLNFYSAGATMNTTSRAYGFSVRCIKD
ncbi:MAG: FISUMP domain-containing protein [Vicingaceae bacterium]